jgi:hypothetical protein
VSALGHIVPPNDQVEQPAFAIPTHRLEVEITSQSTTKIKIAA